MSDVPTTDDIRGWLVASDFAGGSADEALGVKFDMWLEHHERKLRSSIALDIHASKPHHTTRDYTEVDQAYDMAALIAVGGVFEESPALTFDQNQG